MVPILKITDLEKDLFVCINVFSEGLGGFFMQEGCVVAYESRKLKLHENNCVV